VTSEKGSLVTPADNGVDQILERAAKCGVDRVGA